MNIPRAQHPPPGSHPLKGHPCSALRRRIATEIAAQAPPDGYTLMEPAFAHAVNPLLYPKLPFDAVKDFAPILLVASIANLLVVHPSIPAHSVKELIAFAKARPNQLVYGSAGNGTASHFAGELLNMMGGIKVTHIPYKGSHPRIPKPWAASCR